MSSNQSLELYLPRPGLYTCTAIVFQKCLMWTLITDQFTKVLLDK